MQSRLHALAVLALAAAAACGDDEDPMAPQGEAMIRVANLSPELAQTNATVDVLVDGQVVAQNVAFGPGQCVEVPAGNRTIAFRAGGTTVASVTGTVQPGVELTALLFDEAQGTQDIGVVATNVAPPAAGTNALRFINLAAAPGDVFVTAPAEAVSGAPDVAQLDPAEVTPFMPMPATETRARLFPVGTTATPTADVTVPTLSNRIGTVVFLGDAAPGDATGQVLEPCPAT